MLPVLPSLLPSKISNEPNSAENEYGAAIFEEGANRRLPRT